MSFPAPLPALLPIVGLIMGLGLCGAAYAGGGHPAAGSGIGITFGPPASIASPVFIGQASSTVPAPIHPVGHNLGATFIRPPVPPVAFHPVFHPVYAPVVPGFVTFAPPVVVNTTAPVIVNAPPSFAPSAPAVVVVQQAPVIAPSPALFFAPPVRTAAPPPAGGGAMFIRRSGF